MKTYKFIMVLLLMGLFALMVMGAQGCAGGNSGDRAKYAKGQTLCYQEQQVKIISVNHFVGTGYYGEINYDIQYVTKMGEIKNTTVGESYLKLCEP